VTTTHTPIPERSALATDQREELIMFKHILVPTDFGDPAQHALDIAFGLAEKFGARLSILHVYPIVLGMPYGSGFAWPSEQIAAGARDSLAEHVASAKAHYSACEGVLRPGIATDEINTFASESDVDLIVMGTHGRRGLPRFMLGSTAERVVRTSPVPVLTASTKDGAAR
jgi:nucleotide-binding universal stress UspA family protein